MQLSCFLFCTIYLNGGIVSSYCADLGIELNKICVVCFAVEDLTNISCIEGENQIMFQVKWISQEEMSQFDKSISYHQIEW